MATENFGVTDAITQVTGLVDGITYYIRCYTSNTLCVFGSAVAPTNKQVPCFRYPNGGDFSFRKIAGENLYVWILEENGSGILVFDQKA